MKLRELLDKASSTLLDLEVTVKIKTIIGDHNGAIGGVTLRPLEAVEIQDDGSVTLVVTE